MEDAQDTVAFLMNVYENGDGPLVYPVLLADGTNIGYVQIAANMPINLNKKYLIKGV